MFGTSSTFAQAGLSPCSTDKGCATQAWWLTQHLTADEPGAVSRHPHPRPGVLTRPAPRAVIQTVPRPAGWRAMTPGSPFTPHPLSSHPSPDSQRKRTSRLSSAGVWREASLWLWTAPPQDPGSAPRGKTDLGCTHLKPVGGLQPLGRSNPGRFMSPCLSQPGSWEAFCGLGPSAHYSL